MLAVLDLILWAAVAVLQAWFTTEVTSETYERVPALLRNLVVHCDGLWITTVTVRRTVIIQNVSSPFETWVCIKWKFTLRILGIGSTEGSPSGT